MNQDTAAPKERLIVVSNRLPFTCKRGITGEWKIAPGAGGLVTALLPVLRNRGGTWIGWPGTASEDAADLEATLSGTLDNAGYTLKPVMLTAEEMHKFYQGFSNEIIWPLFHDLQMLCNFEPDYWHVYQEVNRNYAEVISENSTDTDFIWVHDYHLMNVATELRRMGRRSKTGFFLHIPFPSLDIFVKLPWRLQLLRALLDYDIIGFQTLRDRRNFIQCIRALMEDVTCQGKGQVLTVTAAGREIRVGSFPIGIDYEGFLKQAAGRTVGDKAAHLHRMMPDRQLILGVDRLDHTKGIPDRLRAFRHALVRHPELHERVTLIQVVVPSREEIPKYHELKTQIDRLVGEINGQFTRPGGWVPIHYIFRNLEFTDLLAYYRAAEIALVTPLKDGMNLVAKEFCTCSIEENSVLILSEFAGAAAQLQRGALLVNPHDIEGMADTIYAAFVMDKEERRARMRGLRRSTRKNGIFWWVDSFLSAAIAKDLNAFPLPEDYLPEDYLPMDDIHATSI